MVFHSKGKEEMGDDSSKMVMSSATTKTASTTTIRIMVKTLYQKNHPNRSFLRRWTGASVAQTHLSCGKGSELISMVS